MGTGVPRSAACRAPLRLVCARFALSCARFALSCARLRAATCRAPLRSAACRAQRIGIGVPRVPVVARAGGIRCKASCCVAGIRCGIDRSAASRAGGGGSRRSTCDRDAGRSVSRSTRTPPWVVGTSSDESSDRPSSGTAAALCATKDRRGRRGLGQGRRGCAVQRRDRGAQAAAACVPGAAVAPEITELIELWRCASQAPNRRLRRESRRRHSHRLARTTIRPTTGCRICTRLCRRNRARAQTAFFSHYNVPVTTVPSALLALV
jgi:hypothetical protein